MMYDRSTRAVNAINSESVTGKQVLLALFITGATTLFAFKAVEKYLHKSPTDVVKTAKTSPSP